MNSTFLHTPGRRPWRLPVLLILMLGLPGCQALTERLCELRECRPLSSNGDGLEGHRALLDELRRIDTLTAEQRHQRYEMLGQPVEGKACQSNNVRMAMLYDTLEAPPEDHLTPLTEAMEACIDAGRPQSLSGMARILHSRLSKRAADASHIHELRQAVNQQQTRNAALTEQLEALKAIERSLRDRSQGTTTTREE